MAVTITRTQVRQEMLRRAPVLGRALTADSFTKVGPAVVDISEYERQRSGLTAFEGQYIHRYNLADNDRWRLGTALDSGATNGVLNVDGPPYVDNTDLAYERLTVHPDDLNFAIAEAQRRQRVRTSLALTRGSDLDCEFATAVYWGAPVALGGSVVSNLTPTKITTDVRTGTKALHGVATGTPWGVRGEMLSVNAGSLIFVGVMLRVLSGSVNFRLYDVQNNAHFGDLVTWSVSNGDWVFMCIQSTVPAGCAQVQVEFQGLDATTVFDVDTCYGPYQGGQTDYLLQSAFNEAYKLRFVRPMRFLMPTSVANVWDGESMEYIGDLVTPEDWALQNFYRDVNSNRLHFVSNSYNNRNVGWGLPNGASYQNRLLGPVMLAMEAQVSDFEPLTAESGANGTTSQPLDVCACYALRYLAETMSQRQPGNTVWATMLQEYKLWSVVEDQARPPQPMVPPQRYHHTLA